MPAQGKVCVVTGAAGGIGRETALRFVAEGARICVADVAAEDGMRTAADCGDAFLQKADVTDEGSVVALMGAAISYVRTAPRRAHPADYERRCVHLPMGRAAQGREIANAALFLASDESS